MLTNTLIDSHCHLDFEVFDKDRAQVLQRAEEHGIKHIIIPGTEKKYWERINELCEKHHQLHPCYGLHPYWVGNHKESDIEQLNTYIENENVAAIGECGLDFREGQADKITQLFFFEAQLALAQKHHLPVVIHSVKATENVIQSLKKFNSISGMVHSYSGSLEQAKQLIDLGFYISIGGSVTYDNAKKSHSVVREIPLTSLLLETDAPDQADQKNTGQRNEPCFLINTVQAIAELKNLSPAVVAEQTTKNAKQLFKL